MRRLWHGLLTHRLATLFFFGLWFVTWLVTVVTWERDAAGFSIGMNPLVIPVHLLLPLILGLLIEGLYRSDTPGVLTGACVLAGAIFAITHFVVLSLADLLWLPQVESSPPFAEMVAGTIFGAVLYVGICIVLGLIGCGVGRVLATRWRHRP